MSKSEQARADAMADAETLRRSSLKIRAFDADRESLVSTISCGRATSACAYFTGKALAHVAFRAVPGLRGEATR
jgi:hypothetical protein